MIGSEAATNGGGKISTYGGKTHVVWQDSTRRGYLNRMRTLDHDSGKWIKSFTLNRRVDNHARPVIAIDHHRYLHVVMSGIHLGNYWSGVGGRWKYKEDPSGVAPCVPIHILYRGSSMIPMTT